MEDVIWPAALQNLIDDFAEAIDASERYEMLFELADEIDELPMSEWSEATRVHGCQSEAHVIAELNEDGCFHLRGAADSRLVQGLIAVTATALEGLEVDEVLSFSPAFVEEMGLKQALSPNRANGFLNMFKKVQQEAEAMR